jgi:hypothetical protein
VFAQVVEQALPPANFQKGFALVVEQALPPANSPL